MKLASSIKVLNYKNHGKKIKSNELPYWNLEFNTDNKNKWENALKVIESKANKQIQKYLYETFNTLILNLEKLKKYEIEDIEVEISEAFRNYEATISNRLVFLKEQAQIARSLNLPKNTPENRIISTAGVTKEDNFSNYYMRGYEMIEKEIDLIQNRTDKKPFIENLIDLEKEKNRLLKDKDIDRIQTLFENTPIAKSDNFFAAKIENKSTQYKQLNFKTSIMMQMLISAGLFGLIFGMIYVLIANAAKKRK
jgi:LPS O-antigen subunit length determinant protein (WzzB/FepE family)